MNLKDFPIGNIVLKFVSMVLYRNESLYFCHYFAIVLYLSIPSEIGLPLELFIFTLTDMLLLSYTLPIFEVTETSPLPEDI